MRVVVYTDAEGIGGAEISLGHLVATAFPEIELTVVGVSQTVVDAIANRRPPASRIVLPARGIQSAIAHFTTLHRLRPDIVHVNLCTPWAGATGLTAALTLPHARVVRVDQLPLRTTDAIALWRTRWLSLRVDAHVAVGQGSARKMEDFYALGRQSVLSIPNGVPDPGEPTSLREKPDAATDFPLTAPITIGSIGRLDRMKGHDLLLRAIAPLDSTQVIILGEGGERQALEQQAQALGIGDRVQFPGWVDAPRSYLPRFDIVAMPSRSEGFPLAIVEAMLAARPVVASRVGSVAEAVRDGETGFLVEKDDVEGLRHALKRLCDEPALRQHMGQRGRAIAAAQFTAEQMTASYEQLWHKLRSLPQSPRLLIPRPRD